MFENEDSRSFEFSLHGGDYSDGDNDHIESDNHRNKNDDDDKHVNGHHDTVI